MLTLSFLSRWKLAFLNTFRPVQLCLGMNFALQDKPFEHFVSSRHEEWPTFALHLHQDHPNIRTDKSHDSINKIHPKLAALVLLPLFSARSCDSIGYHPIFIYIHTSIENAKFADDDTVINYIYRILIKYTTTNSIIRRNQL